MISGRASLISRFIFRITPMCSSLFRREYFSSRRFPPRPPCDALYVSRLAWERTTTSLCVSLSWAAIGTCCSATSCGSWGGGHDCVHPSQAFVSIRAEPCFATQQLSTITATYFVSYLVSLLNSLRKTSLWLDRRIQYVGFSQRKAEAGTFEG